MLYLDRLPIPTEADLIREAVGIKRRRHLSPEAMTALAARLPQSRTGRPSAGSGCDGSAEGYLEAPFACSTQNFGRRYLATAGLDGAVVSTLPKLKVLLSTVPPPSTSRALETPFIEPTVTWFPTNDPPPIILMPTGAGFAGGSLDGKTETPATGTSVCTDSKRAWTCARPISISAGLIEYRVGAALRGTNYNRPVPDVTVIVAHND